MKEYMLNPQKEGFKEIFKNLSDTTERLMKST